MQWPFRKTETEIQVYRDPKNQELTLSMKEDWKLAVLGITVDVRSKLRGEAALQLRDQINALLGAEGARSSAL